MGFGIDFSVHLSAAEGCRAALEVRVHVKVRREKRFTIASRY